MFCEKCGQANPDEAKFCEGCGAELQAAGGNNTPEGETPSFNVGNNALNNVKDVVQTNSDLIKKIIKIAIPVVAVAVVFAILSAIGLFTHASEKALKKYVKAYTEGDAETVFQLTVNPSELEVAMKNEYYEDEEDMKEACSDEIEDAYDYYTDMIGSKIKLKEFEVRDVTKYEKKDIEDINKYLEENYYEGAEVEDIRVIRARRQVKGKEGKRTLSDEYVVYKMEGKWYVSTQDSFEKLGNIYDKTTVKNAIRSN